MNTENQKLDNFTRRAFVVGAFQGLLLTVLGGRLAWLQISEGEKYRTLAENNRINIKIIAPTRGEIVDRFGVPLAVNKQDFMVVITPEQAENLEQSIRKLQKYITIDERDIKRVLRDSKKHPRYVPIQIRDEMTWDDVAKVELHSPDLPGIAVFSGEARSYPYREATAHLIGYVGRVSEEEMTDDPLLRLPGFKIGKNGLEKQFENNLRGIPGKNEIEVNVHGREVRPLGKTQAQAGQRMVLTIDAELQRFVQQRLANEKSASAIIMNVHTGSIYALASHPSYDPNNFAGGISAMDWEQLRDDPTHPLNNKVVTGLYPPGSTFKMMTALAGLKAGVISQHSTVSCPGHYDFGNNRFHCWKRGGHGTVNLTKALAESCDTYFYKMATNVGIDKIAEMARSFGLGQKLDIGLPEEKSGLMPDQKWKRKNRKESWHAGETIISSIGQGYIQSTPLQLVTMTARLVNGGVAVEPWLTGKSEGGTVAWPSLGIDPAFLQMIKIGMDRVLQPGGTANAQQIKEVGMQMGGKTGTSQVKRITKAERAQGMRKQEDLPWNFRHHALFVGYAPVEKPVYACAVVVEHGGSGSGAAAPVAKDIMLECQKRNPATKSMVT